MKFFWLFWHWHVLSHSRCIDRLSFPHQTLQWILIRAAALCPRRDWSNNQHSQSTALDFQEPSTLPSRDAPQCSWLKRESGGRKKRKWQRNFTVFSKCTSETFKSISGELLGKVYMGAVVGSACKFALLIKKKKSSFCSSGWKCILADSP